MSFIEINSSPIIYRLNISTPRRAFREQIERRSHPSSVSVSGPTGGLGAWAVARCASRAARYGGFVGGRGEGRPNDDNGLG